MLHSIHGAFPHASPGSAQNATERDRNEAPNEFARMREYGSFAADLNFARISGEFGTYGARTLSTSASRSLRDLGKLACRRSRSIRVRCTRCARRTEASGNMPMTIIGKNFWIIGSSWRENDPSISPVTTACNSRTSGSEPEAKLEYSSSY